MQPDDISYSITFDDVLLTPTKSTISSRFNGDIDLSVELVPGIKLDKPIISANMDTVTGLQMANAMADLGGLGVVHRFMTIEEHKKVLKESKGYKVIKTPLITDDWTDFSNEYNYYVQGNPMVIKKFEK